MRSAKAKDKRLRVALDMPPLRRMPINGTYAYKTDEVFAWIAQRPGLLNYVFDKLNQGGYIVFDSQTGTWRGADYES